MDLFGSDPEHSRRSNTTDGDWWDRLTADSPLWSSEGSLARDDSFSGWLPIVESEIRRSGSPLDGPPDDAPADDSAVNDSAVNDSAVNDSAADVANDPAGDRAPGSGLNGAATASAAGSGGAGAGSAGAGDAGGGAGRGRSSGVRSSWVLVASLRESAQALALAPVPDDAGVCLAEA
ncbi:hypothetical protein AB0O28_04400, partial [Microbispora sp. NPDC088329]|uniref:hypothetical protein n=1 Tax=Microbispora sp. NPDC088329 TaxID=3154869 RepID=UPI00344940FA